MQLLQDHLFSISRTVQLFTRSATPTFPSLPSDKVLGASVHVGKVVCSLDIDRLCACPNSKKTLRSVLA